MAGFIRLTNPIWWIQVHMLGGWKRILSYCGVYLAIMVACTLAYRRMEPPGTSLTSLCSGLLHALSILQMVILVLGGCTVISKAISRDMQTKMIESHRLSAMDALGTMWGYLLGPTIMVLLLWAVGVLYGTVLCGLGGLGLQGWLGGGGILLLSCLSIWSLVVFVGVAAQKPSNVGAAVIGLALLGRFWVIFFPGAGLFLGAYPIINSYWLMNSRPAAYGAGMPIMVVTCVVMLFIWIMAAARKYRHPQRCAFGPIAALGVLVVWLVLSLLGIGQFASLGVSLGALTGMGQTHFIAALIVSLFVGILPLHSLASAEIRAVRARARAPWSERASPMVFAILIVVLICGLLGVGDVPDWDGRTAVYPTNLQDAGFARWLPCAVALLCGLLAIGGLLRFAYSTGQKPLFLCSLFVVIAWGFPIVGDVGWANWKLQMSDPYNATLPFSWIFGSSPPGTLVAVWTDMPITFWPGLVVQAIIAALLQLLGYRAMGGERRRRLAGDS
ncbi:MAG: hypothetical protein IID37_05290 [Planctomycetes bacterium]|nr:hypothetical protein [Planctomycetota bacterium]